MSFRITIPSTTTVWDFDKEKFLTFFPNSSIETSILENKEISISTDDITPYILYILHEFTNGTGDIYDKYGPFEGKREKELTKASHYLNIQLLSILPTAGSNTFMENFYPMCLVNVKFFSPYDEKKNTAYHNLLSYDCPYIINYILKRLLDSDIYDGDDFKDAMNILKSRFFRYVIDNNETGFKALSTFFNPINTLYDDDMVIYKKNELEKEDIKNPDEGEYYIMPHIEEHKNKYNTYCRLKLMEELLWRKSSHHIYIMAIMYKADKILPLLEKVNLEKINLEERVVGYDYRNTFYISQKEITNMVKQLTKEE